MFYIPLRHTPAKSVILETDICADVDDVGALALLLQYSRQYGFRIAGISDNCPVPESADAIGAILASRGFAPESIPIGLAGAQERFSSSYLKEVATHLPAAQHGKTRTQESVSFYREILEAAPAHSIRVISIGFFNLLDQAWREMPELFQEKVEAVIIMGGSFLYKPGYREFNIVGAFQECSTHFIETCPVRMYFSGFEVGNTIFTDLSPMAANTADPVIAAYRAYSRQEEGKETYRRMSWDPLTVDFAVFGEGPRYRLSPPVDIRIDNGAFSVTENPAALRQFVIQNQDDEFLGKHISREILATVPKE